MKQTWHRRPPSYQGCSPSSCLTNGSGLPIQIHKVPNTSWTWFQRPKWLSIVLGIAYGLQKKKTNWDMMGIWDWLNNLVDLIFQTRAILLHPKPFRRGEQMTVLRSCLRRLIDGTLQARQGLLSPRLLQAACNICQVYCWPRLTCFFPNFLEWKTAPLSALQVPERTRDKDGGGICQAKHRQTIRRKTYLETMKRISFEFLMIFISTDSGSKKKQQTVTTKMRLMTHDHWTQESWQAVSVFQKATRTAVST